MRYTRLIIIACVLCALVFPLQAFAESKPFYGDVKGTVYSQAFKASGAHVFLKTMDAETGVETGNVADTYTDSSGNFKFDYVVFSPDKQFQYMIRADKGSNSALAWVYALPADNYSDSYVAPINMDLSVPSKYTDTTVTVWSTQARTTTNTNLGVVPRVMLHLYKVDLNGGNRTQVGSSYTTDNIGQYTFTGLPYGLYVVRAESMGQAVEQPFAAYQQISSVTISTNLPIPSPTPTPKPTATPRPGSTGNETSSGGFFGIPGFEAVAALIALLGAALYLRRA
ncbi:MAG: PGF-CTERM sorting domain-containing protein [Methanocella sp.]